MSYPDDMRFEVFMVVTKNIMKSSAFWDITPCSPLKVNQRFGGTRRLLLQVGRISQARNQRKAGGKENKLLAETSEYVVNRREMEDSKSVPVGSPVGQDEPPVPIGSETQPSEPIGD
jgi:hypothetical protein